MKKLTLLVGIFAVFSLQSTVFAQEKSAKAGKIKVRTATPQTGKDDNCYLNGGTAPSDSTQTTTPSTTTVVPVPGVAVDEGKKKAKEAGKSLINNSGVKISFP